MFSFAKLRAKCTNSKMATESSTRWNVIFFFCPFTRWSLDCGLLRISKKCKQKHKIARNAHNTEKCTKYSKYTVVYATRRARQFSTELLCSFNDISEIRMYLVILFVIKLKPHSTNCLYVRADDRIIVSENRNRFRNFISNCTPIKRKEPGDAVDERRKGRR